MSVSSDQDEAPPPEEVECMIKRKKNPTVFDETFVRIISKSGSESSTSPAAPTTHNGSTVISAAEWDAFLKLWVQNKELEAKLSVYEKQEHIDALLKEVEVYKDLIRIKDKQIEKMKRDLVSTTNSPGQDDTGSPILRRHEDEVSISEDNHIIIQSMFDTDNFSEGGNYENYNCIEKSNKKDDVALTGGGGEEDVAPTTTNQTNQQVHMEGNADLVATTGGETCYDDYEMPTQRAEIENETTTSDQDSIEVPNTTHEVVEVNIMGSVTVETSATSNETEKTQDRETLHSTK